MPNKNPCDGCINPKNTTCNPCGPIMENLKHLQDCKNNKQWKEHGKCECSLENPCCNVENVQRKQFYIIIIMPVHNKILMKGCTVKEPPHPCDPKPPCDPCKQGDEPCPKPSLCLEKLKNPMKPHETRCKEGAHIGAEVCTTKEPPHPCDPPEPCIPGKPEKQPCPDVALCKERVKNLESPVIRCPGPEDLFSPEEVCEDLDILKEPIPECPKERCPKLVQINPFDEDNHKEEEEEDEGKKRRPYYYSHKDLCDNLDILKETVKECFRPRCSPPVQLNPFEYEEQMKEIREMFEEEEDPCAFDPRSKKKKK